MKNADKPISPQTWEKVQNHPNAEAYPFVEQKKTGLEVRLGGLTKREYFAGLAMQGLLKTKSVVVAAKMAVSSADALLEELEKTQR